MAIPFLNHLDLRSVSELQNAILHKTTSGAASDVRGKLIYDTGTDTIKYYSHPDGGTGAWISLTGDTNTFRTVQADGSAIGATETLNLIGGTNITLSESSGAITIDAGAATSVGLTNGSQRTGTIELIAGTNVSIAEDAGNNGHFTFSATDTNTQLTQEQVEDFVAGVLTAGEGIDLTYNDSGGTLTIDAEDADATNKGIASFSTDNFSVSSGAVTIKDGGVANDELVNSSITINGSAISLGGSVTTPNTDVDVSKANLKSKLATFDSGDTVYIGDADDDTTVIIRGTLQVDGTTTTVNSETLTVDDNKIVLNDNQTGSPTEDAGLEIERGSGTNVELRWNESDDDWEFQAYNHASTPALTTYKIPTTFKTTIGNGSLTTIAITHNLGTRDVIVQLYDSSSYETVNADVVRTDTNRISMTFASAPANNDVTVLVSKVG